MHSGGSRRSIGCVWKVLSWFTAAGVPPFSHISAAGFSSGQQHSVILLRVARQITNFTRLAGAEPFFTDQYVERWRCGWRGEEMPLQRVVVGKRAKTFSPKGTDAL